MIRLQRRMKRGGKRTPPLNCAHMQVLPSFPQNPALHAPRILHGAYASSASARVATFSPSPRLSLLPSCPLAPRTHHGAHAGGASTRVTAAGGDARGPSSGRGGGGALLAASRVCVGSVGMMDGAVGHTWGALLCWWWVRPT